MKFDDFTEKVQHKAKQTTTGEAIAAIRATLETLAERTAGDEAENLAAQLPERNWRVFAWETYPAAFFTG